MGHTRTGEGCGIPAGWPGTRIHLGTSGYCAGHYVRRAIHEGDLAVTKNVEDEWVLVTIRE